MNFIYLLLMAIFFRIGFDVFASRAGGKINDWLSASILSLIAGFLPLIVYLALTKKNLITTTKEGVVYSVLAGIFVGLFTVVLIKLFERGENLSIVSPAIYGGTIVGVALIGWLVFKEPANVYSVLGVALVALGVGLLIYGRATS